MISDVELDRVLRAWLREGGERAPESDVAAALAVIAMTRQRRRPWHAWIRAGRSRRPAGALILMTAVALILAAIAAAIVVGSVLIRPSPEPTTPQLRAMAIPDWPVAISIPIAWHEIEAPCCDYRHFAGADPEGHLSIGHESPYRTTICSPECEDIEVPATIPYAAASQLDALRAGVEAIAGSTDWEFLPPDALPQIDGASRLETVATDASGRAWRRVHIVGLRERNLVSIAWSQPADTFDPALLAAVLDRTDLGVAPRYGDGDLVDPWSEPDFALPIPGLWLDVEQPTAGGRLLSGVRRFADGRVVVSIGSAEGTLGWCDPDCLTIDGLRSLDDLERAIRGQRDLGPASAVTLDGEPARSMGSADPVERRYVVAMHDQRPVAILIDVGDWAVAPGIIDAMVAGFAFSDPAPAAIDQRFIVADGRMELGLSSDWEAVANRDNLFAWGAQRLTVQVGDDDGSISPCGQPAGPWESCETIAPTSLQELADAVAPRPIADHGIGPPTAVVDEHRIDGEPALVIRIQAYEHPARGGQEVVYVVAMHAGRPYLLRIRTTDDRVVGVGTLIAGVRFLD